MVYTLLYLQGKKEIHCVFKKFFRLDLCRRMVYKTGLLLPGASKNIGLGKGGKQTMFPKTKSELQGYMVQARGEIIIVSE